MTHDEYQATIAEIMKGGDNAADLAAGLLTNIDADATAAADKDKTIAEKDATIKELTDKINGMKVQEFLSKTGKPQETAEKTAEVDKILAGIINPQREGR